MTCDISECGAWCCKFIEIGRIHKSMVKYWMLRGALKREDGKWYVPLRCKWLTKNDRCEHYDRRPEYCREWQCNQRGDSK